MKSILILGKVMLWTEIVFYVGIGIIAGIVGFMLLWFLINRKGKQGKLYLPIPIFISEKIREKK